MKLVLNKFEFWIKDNSKLPFDFDSMSDNEKWEYIYGKKLLHRLEGPARIYPDGTKSWWLNGLRHREDGPAIIDFNGTQAWYLNGKCHRLNGPAVTYFDGSNEFNSWYLDDICLNGEIYKKIQNSSKEELLVYMVDSKYKDYLSLIEYRLNLK